VGRAQAAGRPRGNRPHGPDRHPGVRDHRRHHRARDRLQRQRLELSGRLRGDAEGLLLRGAREGGGPLLLRAPGPGERPAARGVYPGRATRRVRRRHGPGTRGYARSLPAAPALRVVRRYGHEELPALRRHEPLPAPRVAEGRRRRPRRGDGRPILRGPPERSPATLYRWRPLAVSQGTGCEARPRHRHPGTGSQPGRREPVHRFARPPNPRRPRPPRPPPIGGKAPPDHRPPVARVPAIPASRRRAPSRPSANRTPVPTQGPTQVPTQASPPRDRARKTVPMYPEPLPRTSRPEKVAILQTRSQIPGTASPGRARVRMGAPGGKTPRDREPARRSPKRKSPKGKCPRVTRTDPTK
jgi:hypothetical protein